MLVLMLRPDERLVLDDGRTVAEVVLVRTQGRRAVLGIQAPRCVHVQRVGRRPVETARGGSSTGGGETPEARQDG